MAKNKYYPVAEGSCKEVPYIYTSWSECQDAIKGYDSEYKGVKTIEEAVNFIAMCYGVDGRTILNKFPNLVDGIEIDESKLLVTDTVKRDIEINEEFWSKDEDKVQIYVDGSYKEDAGNYSYGMVVVVNDKEVYRENGIGKNDKAKEIRNVAGEMLGAMKAVKYAVNNKYKKIEICYDYQGIKRFARGIWDRKDELSKLYYEYMQKYMKQISIGFKKIAAHSNNYYNDIVDGLAKEALGQ